MKKPIIKSFDKVIVLLLFIFGIFSSCGKEPLYGTPEPEYGVILPMYGVPKADTMIRKEMPKPMQEIPVINEIELQD